MNCQRKTTKDTRYKLFVHPKIHSFHYRLQSIWDTFFSATIAISSDRQFPASPLANPIHRHLRSSSQHLIVYNYALMNASGREHEIMFENSCMKRCMLRPSLAPLAPFPSIVFSYADRIRVLEIDKFSNCTLRSHVVDNDRCSKCSSSSKSLAMDMDEYMGSQEAFRLTSM